jgi:O-methyltransferase
MSRDIKKLEKRFSNASMTGYEHLKYVEDLVKDVNEREIPGSLVEVGVWLGGVAAMMAYTQKEVAGCTRDVYLYDTFDGMQPPDHKKDGKTEREIHAAVKENKDHRLKLNGYFKKDAWREGTEYDDKDKWCYGPLPYVKETMAHSGYDKDKIFYVEGRVEDTLIIPENIPEKIAILRIDVDWYEPTKTSLEKLCPYVSSGGYLIMDDWMHWPGAWQAGNGFLKGNKEFSLVSTLKPDSLLKLEHIKKITDEQRTTGVELHGMHMTDRKREKMTFIKQRYL